VGSSADPTLNGHLKYPNNLDQSLIDAAADKIRKYRADYNNRPPSAVSFMTAIPSTSGSAQTTSGMFQFRRVAFSSGIFFKKKIDVHAVPLVLDVSIAQQC
jgi:hypothetical protein